MKAHFSFGKSGIGVRPLNGKDVQIGDEVEVAGFVVTNGGSASLEDAITRILATDRPREALELSPLQARNSDTTARLVTMKVRLLEHVQQKDRELLTVAALGTTVSVELRSTNQVGRLAALKTDSVLRLTGIWLGPQTDGSGARYRLLLRDAADARVLRWPTWWTPKG